MPSKQLKVICKCECGRDIKITAREAGQFVASFRTKPYDREKLAKAGRLGGLKKKHG